jgi:4-amino-4-deoxy-L-arabinose transferase-like glycosyltransferase
MRCHLEKKLFLFQRGNQMSKPSVNVSNEAGISRGDERQSHWRLSFIIVVAFAAALRLYQLNTESLWIDEGYSIRDATLIDSISKASKPLYYWILSLWMHLGNSDWLLRMPAVLFGVASVALIFLLGRLIWGTKAAVLASLLAAVSPLQVDHSQEVRMYTLLTLTAAGAMYFCLLGLRRGKSGYLFASALCTWLAILTHPVACLLLIPEFTVLLDFSRNRKINLWLWGGGFLLVAVAWIPWIPHVLGFNEGFSTSWASLKARPTLGEIPMLWGSFGLGEWDPGQGHSRMHYILFIYTYASVALMALSAWTDRRRAESRMVTVWLVFPVLVLFLLSIIKTNAWMTRYLIFISPAFFLLLGALWARQKNMLAFAALGVLLFMVPSAKLVRYYQKDTRPEWKQAVQYVMKREKPGDIIALYRRGNENVFTHYYDGKAGHIALGPAQFQSDELIGWNEKKAIKLLDSVPQAPRKWLMLSMVPMSAEKSIDHVIRKHRKLVSYRSFVGIKVYLFEDYHGKKRGEEN